MTTFNENILRAKPSPTLAAGARVQELRAKGVDIVSFTVGEPDFDTPEHVKEAGIKAIQAGKTKYTPVAGILELRKAISEKLKRDQGVDYPAQQICVTNGGKQALAAAISVLINRGDEVIIPSPYWTSYPDMVKMASGEPVFVPTRAEDGYVLQVEALKKACTPRTKMVILNSPSNPTGACYSAEDYKKIGAALKGLPNISEITILLDEVYEPILFGGFKHVSFAHVVPELFNQTVLTSAFSKSYSMTGWRVGYAAGPKAIIDQVSTHQSHFSSNICSIAQYAALAAYDDKGDFPHKMCAAFEERLAVALGKIKTIPGLAMPVPPRGAFYLFVRVEGLFGKRAGTKVIKAAQDFADYLLEEFHVAVVTGEAFGDPGAIRLSYALAESEMVKGLDRIAAAVAKLS